MIYETCVINSLAYNLPASLVAPLLHMRTGWIAYVVNCLRSETAALIPGVKATLYAMTTPDPSSVNPDIATYNTGRYFLRMLFGCLENREYGPRNSSR
jgi:hypothetical protein